MNPADAVPCAIVIDLHAKACAELFTAYGLGAHVRREEERDADGERETYASIVGATGEGLRLSSTMNFDARLLARTHPSGAADVSAADIEDWCRELNNQLMGRLKNKLLRVGCEVVAGLPVLVRGTGIKAVVARDIDHRQYFFTSEHGCMAFTLAMLFAPSFAFPASSGLVAGEEVRHEGVLALF
jgi:hypothetical protein